MTMLSTDTSMRNRPICCLVGNGPVEDDASTFIDRADYVIRFNRCAGLHGVTGSRTDRLYLCNTGRTATRWSTDNFTRILTSARIDVVFSYPRPNIMRTFTCLLMGKRGTSIDGSRELTKTLLKFGVTPRPMETATYDEVRRTLLMTMSRMGPGRLHPLWQPSSGCIALYQALQDPRLADHEIHLVGFGFSGGKLHPWAAERAYAEGLRDCGKIQIHFPDARSDNTYIRLPRHRIAL